MDQQRWEMIREVFDAALELPSSEREAFIREASHQDAEVYAELKNLLHADQEAGEFLESPLLAAGAFQQFSATELPLLPGEVLCQRFRILRAVGEGGMGYVFEAWDMELRRSVALKAVRPEVAGHPESLKRFRQEVSLALRITHPNVCRTFDIERETRVVDTTTGKSREIVFLTMEFLQGETLAERLSRTGSLPLDHALHIAHQIADALACAHQMGIYHRDIKPANIMLVPAALSQASPSSSEFPRTVITDFGLARQEAILRSDGLSGVSSSGIPLGTFAYMAPEQLECAETSAATDIYAFGLVLFEMVTGKRAFSSSNPLSSIRQRLTGPAPSPQSVIPDLSEPWCRAIEGCLRMNPAERLQNAADVMAILDGSKVSLPPMRMENFASHSLSTRRLALASRSIRLRVFALAMILVAIVSLSLVGLRLYQSKADSKVTPGALVYLTPVKNQTGEKAFDNLTELIQAGLTQSAQINLLDQGRVGDILQQMTKSPDTVITEPIAREIAMRAGAPRVVFATVTGTSGSYKLNIDIQQPDASGPNRYRDHWPKSFEWQSPDLTASTTTISQELSTNIRSASDWIRKEAGESASDIARLDAPPEDVTTSNWQALAEYTTSETLQQHQQTEGAIRALQSAINLDPQFSLAYARLGDHLVGLGRYRDGYLAYHKAFDTDQERRLSRRQRDQIRGIYALDSNDFEQAEAAFHDYTIYFPNDYSGWFHRGYPLMMLGRTDEAIATLKHAFQIDPHRLSAPFELANAYISLGQWANASQWLDLAKKDHGAESVADSEGISLFLQGRFSEAETQFKLLIHSSRQEDHSLGYALLARLYAEQGNREDALRTLSTAIGLQMSAISSVKALTYLDRASLQCRNANFRSCFDDVTTALKLDHSPQSAIVASAILGRTLPQLTGDAHLFLNVLHSLAGHERYDEFGTIGNLASLRVEGEILLARGHWQKALVAFRRADKIDAPINEREYLARALEQAADHEPDSNASKSLRVQALEAYARVALHPNTAWQYAEHWQPGFYADQLAAYIHLANSTETSSEETIDAIQRYNALRPLDAHRFRATLHPQN